jgi:drug/metabolite transporter (DMT)-like permease
MLFWLFALVGTVLSFGFFFTLSVGSLVAGDALLGLAVIAATFGYVEGGRLSRLYGGRRVMSWAVLLTLPIALPTALLWFPASIFRAEAFSPPGWFAMAYLALVSQSTGMFLWYRVLARGPMEKVALAQLLQPFFTLLASIYLLRETVSWSAWLIALLVAGCIFGANSARNRPAAAGNVIELATRTETEQAAAVKQDTMPGSRSPEGEKVSGQVRGVR